MQTALACLHKIASVVKQLDQLIVCAQCRGVVREASCRVTCSCASSAVKKRLGQCAYVYYCNKCFEGLRRKDGTLPTEWPPEMERSEK